MEAIANAQRRHPTHTAIGKTPTMAGQNVPAGWYGDPWGEAPLRWWDGGQWTGHLHHPELPLPPTSGVPLEAPPTTISTRGSGPLARLLPAGGRVAVIDVETTGLYNSDRVVEVAVVTLDSHGVIQERFETLVNPNRDLGPVWIHQITASMVVDAPTFDEVAHEVAARIDGAVVCAHNLPFDTRMLANEFQRCQIDVDWGRGLDTLAVTRSKLGVACMDAGIELTDAHRAVADAEATGRLLVAHASAISVEPVAARLAPILVRPFRIVTRDGSTVVAATAPYLVGLTANLSVEADVGPYAEMVAAAISDLKLTATELAELAELAAELGLDGGQVTQAHHDVIMEMIDAAVADSVVTADEYDQLCRAAALLNIDGDLVNRRTEGLRSTNDTIEVTPGLTVCFTGAARDGRGSEIYRETLRRCAIQAGLVPVDSVTASGCRLLVAADPASRSGKAANARKHGVPIASVQGFLDALSDGTPLAVTRLESAGIALVCTECGDSWLAARRSSNPVCQACRRGSRASTAPRTASHQPAGPSEPLTPDRPTTPPPAMPKTDILTCVSCGQVWTRPIVRGRKPQRCPQCN